MFSKLKIYIILLASCLLFTGCSDFLRGNKDKPKDKILNLNTADVKCLEQVPQALNRFFKDEASGETLDPAVDCIKTALATFEKYTKGSSPDSYTGPELQHFLNRYLLQTNQISDAFLNEIMKLKVVILGGNRETLSRQELMASYEFLDILKQQAKSLSGSFQLLLFNNQKASSAENLSATQDNLLTSLLTLLNKSKLDGSRYEFDDFKNFILELDKFIGKSETLKLFIKWLPTVESVKLLFIGEHAKIVAKKEWISSLKWLHRAYFFALNYYYKVRSLNYNLAESWNTLISWTDQAFDLIESSPMMQEKSLLQAQYIDRLIDVIWDLKLFSTTLAPDLMKRTYRIALVHMVEGQPAGKANPSGVIGLKLEHFKVLRQEYNIWRLSQLSVNKAFSENKKIMTQMEFSKGLDSFDINDAIAGRFAVEQLEKETLLRSWDDWKALVQGTKPVVLDAKNKITLLYNLKNALVNFIGLTYSNSLRTWTRFALRGYGTHINQHLGDSKLSEAGLVGLEEDFREFGTAITFLDPRQPNPAPQTFKEGNFFTFHGNGDKWLTMTETFELLNVLMSGGQSIVNQVLVDMRAHGCLLNEKDVMGEPVGKEACFKERLKSQARVYLDNMPWMSQMIAQLSPTDYDLFYKSLMKVARLPETNPAKVEYVEIRTAATLLQYVESLFLVYDKNGDQLFSEDEVVASFPRFKNFILEMAGQDWFTEDIFLYLVYEGKVPSGIKDILSFKAKRMLGLGTVTKLQLINVLGVLKDVPVKIH